jgi:tetratricopeptide (TPR) repeat protein
MANVLAIEDMTRRMRAQDHRSGGGTCADLLLASLPAAHALLDALATDVVAIRLRAAVADLHNLAGWVCFDIGLVTDAMAQFALALRLAKRAGDDALAADIHYRTGRVHLHHNAIGMARAQFQLGELAARAAGSPLAAAILDANQAWAQARLGVRDEALQLLTRAQEHFDRADPASTPAWAEFFTANDLSAISGVVYVELAQTVAPEYANLAVPLLSEAVAGYGEDMARSKAFSLISLATGHLVADDVEQGVVVGHQAVDLCQRLTSSRTSERLRSLRNEAVRRRSHPGAFELAKRIGTFQRARTGKPHWLSP